MSCHNLRRDWLYFREDNEKQRLKRWSDINYLNCSYEKQIKVIFSPDIGCHCHQSVCNSEGSDSGGLWWDSGTRLDSWLRNSPAATHHHYNKLPNIHELLTGSASYCIPSHYCSDSVFYIYCYFKKKTVLPLFSHITIYLKTGNFITTWPWSYQLKMRQ